MLAAASKPATGVLLPGRPMDREGLWRGIVSPLRPFLEEVSRSLSAQVEAFDPEVVPFARYALASQGKQLRPVLVALSGGAVGSTGGRLVEAAVIIEMVHLATLVHDDVMDEAQVRRRRPTLAANWGNEVSVLLGDCLFAQALRLAAAFPTTEVCRAVSTATKTVCSGEVLQTLRRGRVQITRTEYFKILEMKTAELFVLSCDLGATLGGGTGEERLALREYGRNLGTAYQVFDDCVDLFGLETTAGKSLGTDLAGGKLTLPILVVLERAKGADRDALQQMILDWHPHRTAQLRVLLERYDALTESLSIIHGLLVRARQSLNRLRLSEHRDGLSALADYLAQQSVALGVG
jgi:octaprenyl-diphosphate synthase